MPMPMGVKDANFRIVFANAALCQGLGMRREDVVGRTDFDLYPAEDAERHRSFDIRTLASHEPIHFDTTYRAEGVPDMHAQVAKVALRRPDGTVFIVTTMMDVTERREAELALARERHFLDAVIDAIPQPLYVKDREHRWVRVNRAFMAFWGKTPRGDARFP
jgi:two-component system sensor histidine kinase/response regulator